MLSAESYVLAVSDAAIDEFDYCADLLKESFKENDARVSPSKT